MSLGPVRILTLFYKTREPSTPPSSLLLLMLLLLLLPSNTHPSDVVWFLRALALLLSNDFLEMVCRPAESKISGADGPGLVGLCLRRILVH